MSLAAHGWKPGFSREGLRYRGRAPLHSAIHLRKGVLEIGPAVPVGSGRWEAHGVTEVNVTG